MNWTQPVNPRVPLPGKTIRIQRANRLYAIAVVSTEEHIRHVLQALEATAEAEQAVIPNWLWTAAIYHDYRKKIGVQWRLWRNLPGRSYLDEAQLEQLTLDFRATLDPQNFIPAEVPSVNLRDVAAAYIAFAGGVDNLVSAPKLPRPFGNHADEFRPRDFPTADEGWQAQASELIRLHHSFQANDLVSACAQWGEDFARHLYRLMTADHLGSRWAETAILIAEGDDRAQRQQEPTDGTERPRWTDFGEWEAEAGSVSRHETPDGYIADMDIVLSRRDAQTVTVPFQVLYFAEVVRHDD